MKLNASLYILTDIEIKNSDTVMIGLALYNCNLKDIWQ